MIVSGLPFRKLVFTILSALAVVATLRRLIGQL
jgi:hypothetical protein